jgi:hypothetical protein
VLQAEFFPLLVLLFKYTVPHIGDLGEATRRGGPEVPGKKIFVVIGKKHALFPVNKRPAADIN